MALSPYPFNGIPTRLTGGANTSQIGDTFSSLHMLDPTNYHTFFQDFDTFTAAEWTVTETQAGATQALTAGDNGLLLLTNSAADDDLNAIQKLPAAWLLEAGKRLYFRCRFKVSDATQSDFVIGLQVVDTTPLDVTDGIYFLKTDGAATVDFICRKNATTGSTSASAVATVVSDTFVSLGFYYDGVSKVVYEVNGTPLGALDASSTYLPDIITTVSLAIQNGEAVAKTMTIDYVFVAKERASYGA